MTAAIRPPNAGQGRVKGVPNKLTRELREMILGALDELGGQAWLVEQAKANPAAFLTLLGKVLPKDVTVAGDTTLTVIVKKLTADDVPAHGCLPQSAPHALPTCTPRRPEIEH